MTGPELVELYDKLVDELRELRLKAEEKKSEIYQVILRIRNIQAGGRDG